MLSLPIQKDIAEYEPKIIGKLTKRTLACTACAIGAALLTAFYLNAVICVEIDDWGWLVVAAALPFWAVGFWRPDGMKVEEWLPLWIKHALGKDRILYVSAWETEEFEKEVEDALPQGKEGKGATRADARIDRICSGPGSERLEPGKLFA